MVLADSLPDGEFQSPENCWEKKHSELQTIQEIPRGWLLFQIFDKPTSGEVFLDLMQTTKKIIKEFKTRGSLGSRDYAWVESAISRNMGLVKSRVKTLNFRSGNLHLFKEFWNEMSQQLVLGKKEWSRIGSSFGILSGNTRALLPPVLEIRKRKQETSMAEQGSPGQREG